MTRWLVCRTATKGGWDVLVVVEAKLKLEEALHLRLLGEESHLLRGRLCDEMGTRESR